MVCTGVADGNINITLSWPIIISGLPDSDSKRAAATRSSVIDLSNSDGYPWLWVTGDWSCANRTLRCGQQLRHSQHAVRIRYHEPRCARQHCGGTRAPNGDGASCIHIGRLSTVVISDSLFTHNVCGSVVTTDYGVELTVLCTSFVDNCDQAVTMYYGTVHLLDSTLTRTGGVFGLHEVTIDHPSHAPSSHRSAQQVMVPLSM
jgi:hypothetical protein